MLPRTPAFGEADLGFSIPAITCSYHPVTTAVPHRLAGLLSGAFELAQAGRQPPWDAVAEGDKLWELSSHHRVREQRKHALARQARGRGEAEGTSGVPGSHPRSNYLSVSLKCM